MFQQSWYVKHAAMHALLDKSWLCRASWVKAWSPVWKVLWNNPMIASSQWFWVLQGVLSKNLSILQDIKVFTMPEESYWYSVTIQCLNMVRCNFSAWPAYKVAAIWPLLSSNCSRFVLQHFILIHPDCVFILNGNLRQSSYWYLTDQPRFHRHWHII